MATVYSLGQAGGCLLTQTNELNVNWKAYKTLAKIGVGGKFTDVSYSPNKLEAKNFTELLVGSKITIDTRKIDTKNPDRDETLVKFFFNKLSDNQIEGVITDIKAFKRVKNKPRRGMVTISLLFNKITLLIPMEYEYKDNKFSAEGNIDLADFGASPALKSINKNCFDLHKGKTWSDVSIKFSTTIKASLCDVNLKK